MLSPLSHQASPLNQQIAVHDCGPGEAAYPVAGQLMQTTNSIIMQAPRARIFETAADLSQWPRILPHYRYVTYLQRDGDRNLVKMAARRSGIPVSWTSEEIIDRDRWEVRFHHLKAFTRGMKVVWTFKETPAGVLVEIRHDLRFRFPLLAPIADRVIGGFFIEHIANRTLRAMKSYLEEDTKSEARNPKQTEMKEARTFL